MKSYDRAFVTGCDEGHAWMLEWFLKNYRKHNDTPIIFADFGVSPSTLSLANQLFDDVFTPQLQNSSGWFYKPQTMYKVTEFVKEVCWIDTDIHVLGDMSGIFKYIQPGKLTMVEDRPWTKRTGEKWHNSGIVAFRGQPPILRQWMIKCLNTRERGDQEVLHTMIGHPPLLKLQHVADAPNIYNWLRVQLIDNEDNPKKLAMHWTGAKGKDQIRKIMYNE